MKICSICKKQLELSLFRKDKQKKDGLRSSCKICEKEKYQNNRDYHIERAKEYYKENSEIKKEYSRQWRRLNPEKVKEHKKRNYIKNIEHYRKYKARYHKERYQKDVEYRKKLKQSSVRRRKNIKRATPKWANMTKISDLYEKAYYMRNIENKDVHVDHIIPINGKNVCGLHVSYNLRIIPAQDNLSKGNRLI